MRTFDGPGFDSLQVHSPQAKLEEGTHIITASERPPATPTAQMIAVRGDDLYKIYVVKDLLGPNRQRVWLIAPDVWIESETPEPYVSFTPDIWSILLLTLDELLHD